MLPVQYTPKHEIICYDETVYYFDSDKLPAMDIAMKVKQYLSNKLAF